ncbi:MAG: Mut7-C ubiquitin/RNAse domain-containing protein [Gammaproteobacteria bacterium]|nr:Mut7-C ubiquitin/RNAse domain-containing protein [Gammaproteobacteria bacterium]
MSDTHPVQALLFDYGGVIAEEGFASGLMALATEQALRVNLLDEGMQKHDSFVRLRFYAELNDFLLPWQQQTNFHQRFEQTPSVKDLIESVGIPHTEIRLILVDSKPVDFNYAVKHKDHISIYPAFKRLDISTISKTQPSPLSTLSFVLDTHLGKLARHLRMLGLDTAYKNDFNDEELAHISACERRIRLTRDRNLLKRKVIEHGYFVRETDAVAQLKDIVLHFRLKHKIQPFSRCIVCNGQLRRIDKKRIQHQLHPMTRQHYEDFKQCKNCGKVYWKGSHYVKMNTTLSTILSET